MELIKPQVLQKLKVQVLQSIYENANTGRSLYLVRHQTTHKTYALKLFDISLNSESHIRNEMIALNRLPFSVAPHVHAYEHFENKLALLIDWIDGKSFSEKFRELPKDKFEVKERLFALMNAAERLRSLHFKKIFHRDIKPENLIVDGDKAKSSVWIIDFGNSTQKRSLDEGTINYRAPEQYLALNFPIDSKTDVFSLAQVAWLLLTGSPAQLLPNQQCTDWLDPDYPFFAVDTEYSHDLFKLLESATQFNPKQRKDIHSFIQELKRLCRR
ncbi:MULTISPECIES: protein kinase domain-containing protein [Pseudidiomarina]|uniref:non-specific serine/threonine protein kinase n=2 Tax=Pseudidiomarina TaxID=2800384 RepID=A0A368UYZ3_9GAMM|nr:MULTISPECIES: protein kinase [Pseudidiomarina]PWW14225.1 serine/threonine-protein kinase [Pseudidiomarina maritima]RBP92039.1 serine/threonine-protein kinase [Pseudidiomarina tainanensis]RCW33803.1 serine/threonine-protein kinase [Pseudidiomarina tainanensis]